MMIDPLIPYDDVVLGGCLGLGVYEQFDEVVLALSW
jgi:hypothetical protein